MDNKVVRKRQKLFRYAVDTFVILLEQVTKRKRINYKCNNSDSSAWNNFMDTFDNCIGEDFVRKFIEYGIQSWFNNGTKKDYSHSVRFSWVFGQPAINRWKKNSVATNMFIVRNGIKKDHNINLIEKTNEMQNIVTSVREVEEKFKSDFHNKRKGFMWCIANTTLYFHKSSNCVTCDFKKECKELLKKEYKFIYIRRGYGK